LETSRVPAPAHVYRLCGWCLERQGEATGSFELAKGKDCYVCGGTMDRVEEMAAAASKKARRYQFATFAAGVSIPEGVQEKEDELRSDLKTKGSETVKTQAARLVAQRVAAAMRKRVDKQMPDLTLLVDFVSGEVAASSRPLFFTGRYTKPRRVSQRRELCEECHGSGCGRCGGTGFERGTSVEELLRRKLSAFSGSDRMTFTWLGSEDKGSVVYPPGRPFVVEVKSPRKRKVPKKFAARFRGGQVAVSAGRVLPSKPVRLPPFRFRTAIVGVAGSKVSAEGLAELKAAFKNAEVRFDRPHDRPTTKMVYRLGATARGRRILIDAELDGGLPVKRFVSGDLVSPSVSEVLKTEVKCRSFDICRVWEKGKFELAEIARVAKKN
jgi:tRNA pseudouridine synthase 10